MAIVGVKGFMLLFLSLLLAVYINFPAPKAISKNLARWEQTAATTTVIKGHKIFYKDEYGRKPDAPVLLCLHGFPTSNYDWIKVWPALLEKFSRVLAPDFLGLGLSSKPLDHRYTIMEQADIVEDLLAKVKVNSVHILAHDYGDTVAQELLARFESRQKSGERGLLIHSVALLNGGIFPETCFPRFLQKALLVPYLGQVLSRLTNIYMFSRGFGEVFGPSTKPTPDEYKDFWALIRRDDGHLVMGKLLQYIPQRSANRYRWTTILQTTTVPVHMIYGPADPVNPPPFVDFYKKTVPNPSISVLDGHIGHYPQWEDPSACMKEYFKFLKTLPFYDATPDPSELGEGKETDSKHTEFKVKDTKPRKRSQTVETGKLMEEKSAEPTENVEVKKKASIKTESNRKVPQKSDKKQEQREQQSQEPVKPKKVSTDSSGKTATKEPKKKSSSGDKKTKECSSKPKPRKPDLLDDFGEGDVIEMELKRKEEKPKERLN